MSKSLAKGKENVGGYVPTNLVGHLSLYCAVNNVSRASLIELVLTNLLNSSPSTDDMINTMATKMVEEWKRPYVSVEAPKKLWKKFAERKQKGLIKKKIPAQIVKKIIQRAKQEAFE